MNLFEALLWMCTNQWMHLEAQDTGCGQAFQCRIASGMMQRRVAGGSWLAWGPYWERYNKYVFSMPEHECSAGIFAWNGD